MTKDSILGWFLIFLVGASLFLSFSIWYRTPGVMTQNPLDVVDSKVDLASVLGPEKILLRLGDSAHTLLRPSSSYYEKVWSFSRKTMALQWSGASPDSTETDVLARKRGLEADFPVSMPISALRQLIDVKPPESSSLEGKLIDAFLFAVEDQKLVIYLKDSQGVHHKLSKTGDPAELQKLLQELSNTRPPLYAKLPSGGGSLIISKPVYVSLLSYELPVYSLKRERPPGEGQVAEYFSDFSAARRIQEKDGAVIYTDGQRGLRVYEDGSLEYSFPGASGQKKTSFFDSLTAAVNFVNRHGGWPKNGYLSSFETQGQGQYTFKFRIRINGYPVISEKDIIALTVGGSEIKGYHRNIVGVDRQNGTKPIDTPVKALDTAVAVKNIKEIDGIYPAYFIQGDELLPTWVVETGGMEVILPNPSE